MWHRIRGRVCPQSKRRRARQGGQHGGEPSRFKPGQQRWHHRVYRHVRVAGRVIRRIPLVVKRKPRQPRTVCVAEIWGRIRRGNKSCGVFRRTHLAKMQSRARDRRLSAAPSNPIIALFCGCTFIIVAPNAGVVRMNRHP